MFMIHETHTGDVTDKLLGVLPNAYAAIAQADAEVRVVTIAIYSSIVVALVLMTVAIVLPALVNVERARDDVLLAFMALPKPVLVQLRARARTGGGVEVFP